jgi:hypothetical protein
MSIANPTALFWAVLAVPIIIFYILKIRLRRIPVATVLFWAQIFDEKKPRSLWQKLRHFLSLLVQLALLLFLVGALVEPFFSWEAAEARRVVLVIDNSASMNATDVAPSRLAVAQEKGLAVIAGLRHRDEMAIVSAGTQPQVICGLTGHQRTLRDALTAVGPTDGPTLVTDAVALARRLIAEEGATNRNTQVVVLTDACSPELTALADAADVVLIAVGTEVPNLAITRLQVRRSLIDPIGYDTLVEVVNHSSADAESRLEIELNGRAVDVFTLKLKPNERWSQVIDNKVSAEGGKLTAKLTAADALAVDNLATALLPKRAEQAVLLVCEQPNLYLEKVLEANPVVRLSVVRKLPTTIPANTVVIYHRITPNELPAAPCVIIDPANDTTYYTASDKFQNVIITQQDKESPLMTNLRLDNVLLPEARKLSFLPAAGKPRILAASVNGEPVLVALEPAERKVLLLGINLDRSDLTLRTAFPILMTNALTWFAGERGELRPAYATGATAEVPLPADQKELVLRAPNGAVRPVPTGVASTTIGPFDQAGVWSIAPPGADTPALQEVAVNLANAAESDLRPNSAVSEKPIPTQLLAGSVFGRPTWFYLLFLAFVLAAVEWYLYQRRWIS